MADLSQNNSSQIIGITGGDEQFVADVIEENGAFKLLVKATSVPVSLGDLFFEYAEKAGSNDLNVNGAGTTQEFTIDAHPTQDRIVGSLVFEAFDSGIKIDKFLSLNSSLNNGVLVEIKSEDVVFTFEPIRNTQEFDSLFSFGSGRSYELISASGNDSLVARFGDEIPFIIKSVGTYPTDDYIKVLIQDNLNSINRLRFLAAGKLL